MCHIFQLQHFTISICTKLIILIHKFQPDSSIFYSFIFITELLFRCLCTEEKTAIHCSFFTPTVLCIEQIEKRAARLAPLRYSRAESIRNAVSRRKIHIHTGGGATVYRLNKPFLYAQFNCFHAATFHVAFRWFIDCRYQISRLYGQWLINMMSRGREISCCTQIGKVILKNSAFTVEYLLKNVHHTMKRFDEVRTTANKPIPETKCSDWIMGIADIVGKRKQRTPWKKHGEGC